MPRPEALKGGLVDELEKEYLLAHYEEAQYLIRLVLPIILILLIATGIGNEIVNPGWRKEGMRIVIFAFLIPIVFGQFAVACFCGMHLGDLGAVLALCLGVGLVLISGFGGRPDAGIHILYFFTVHMFMRLRYVVASLICYALTFWFAVVTSVILPPISGEDEEGEIQLQWAYLIFTGMALTMASWIVEYWHREQFYSRSKVMSKNMRTADLLSRFLPPNITKKLQEMKKEEKKFLGERVKDATILFADLVGFTKLSSSIPPRELVQFLNELYLRFDNITEKHSVYKVETIGDEYFVASGVPVKDPNHLRKMMDCAIDMVKELRHVTPPASQKDYKLRMRVGIHTGPVIAGIVGTKMPRYHLFGDTVMIASKMESRGKPNCIQVSERVYRKLRTLNKYKFIKSETPVHIPDLDANINTYFLDSEVVTEIDVKTTTKSTRAATASSASSIDGQSIPPRQVSDEKSHSHVLSLGLNESVEGKTPKTNSPSQVRGFAVQGSPRTQNSSTVALSNTNSRARLNNSSH
eukprot:CAMPEP_0167748448 /NCGR_PEP_ID=MMETSP0110_2-20121227/4844_1 /TAXON_ID=629695 /ORGANISM="Gymnochlora sp., Strain CCMP2014" /LENGTH=522 /DNA_ID=CAMNT_0007633465 /DNA_START=250 /DNA_END=1821 /DNA_ORIENTATION=-